MIIILNVMIIDHGEDQKMFAGTEGSYDDDHHPECHDDGHKDKKMFAGTGGRQGGSV